MCSLDWVVRQYEQWTRLCPAIIPFYAVKCNNDPVLLHTVSNIHNNTSGALLVSRCFSVFKEMGERHDKVFFNGNFPISKFQMMILLKYAVDIAFALASSRLPYGETPLVTIIKFA